MKYVYYATLYNDDGQVGVSFYDFPSVNTFGEDEFDAIKNAQEALEGYLWLAEDEKMAIPDASHFDTIPEHIGERLVAIQVDTTLIRLQEENKL